jgi:hypothetical protein
MSAGSISGILKTYLADSAFPLSLGEYRILNISVSKHTKTAVTASVNWRKHVTLWLFNIAMENGPFIDGLPIKNCDFP